MPAASWTRIALGSLLALSVGIKLVHGSHTRPDPAAWLAKHAVASLLRRQGFRVDPASIRQTDTPVVQAVTDTCNLLVVAAAPQGWHRDLVHRLAVPGDRVFFVVHGRIYDDQPLWRTWSYHYWRLANHLIGRRLPDHPVFGIVASDTCNLRGLPWTDIATIP